MIGQTLAHYEITASLGAGGMGEVFRARDTKLKREVAIKVLPQAFVDDDNRRARFEREAELLASLNHPNIAQIYGIETLDDVHALVIELVEGPTLADRIAAGPIPVDEALAIAGQIADALESAHGQGIVHRDLKPANIKLKDDGTVKVLDFGIAKAIETRTTGLDAPALTSPAQTAAGIVLGTAAYMAPEQARGKPLDQRADIWAYGCILYEMLTGQPTFAGEDRTSTLARVLEREPDTGALPKDLAPSVARTIRLCLEKDPRKRVADIRDVRLALTGTFDTGAMAAASATAARRPAWLWAAAAGLVIGAAGAWLWGAGFAPAPSAAPPPARYSVSVPSAIDYLGRTDLGTGAISPDGRNVVVFGRAVDADNDALSQLWLWPTDSLEARPLTDTVGARTPFWSQDGRSILFTADGFLKRIDLNGGGAVSIRGSNPSASVGATNSDGIVLFINPDGGISRIAADGGVAVAVTAVPISEISHDEIPVFLPDGRHFLYFHHELSTDPVNTSRAARNDGAPASDRLPTGIYLGDIDAAPAAQSMEPLLLADDGPAFVAPPGARFGHILFVLDRTLMARRFDTDRLQLDGPAIPLHAPIDLGTGGQGARSFTASSDGSIVLVEPEGSSRSEELMGDTAAETLTWVSRDGTLEPLELPLTNLDRVDLSPDGSRIAAQMMVDNVWRVWLSDIDRPGWVRLSAGDDWQFLGDWSPDGERILVRNLRGDSLSALAVSGNDSPERLITMEGRSGAVLWLDEETLLYTADNVEFEIADIAAGLAGEPVESRGDMSIHAVSLAIDPPEFTAIIERPNTIVASPAVSPDGRLIAYQSNETGEIEIYVERFPEGGDKTIITNGPEQGWAPGWSPAGDELYFRRVPDGAMMAAAVVDAEALRFGPPEQLFYDNRLPGFDLGTYAGLERSWDIAPDGRFLMILRPGRDDAAAESNAPPDVLMLLNLLQNLP